MKLRNKKTGETIEFDAILPVKGVVGDSVAHLEYGSLTELNSEWEDYEEPTTYYYISDFGAIREGDVGKFVEDEIARKQIGNYFETKEEAEKAVEKLEAIKRIKDHNVKFNLDFVKNKIDFTYRIDGTLHSSVDEERIIFEDLALLFGGEE